MPTLGETNTYQRRNDLDALRTFSMLLGIVLHAGLSFANIPWVVQDIQRNDAFGIVFAAIHGFRMPLFFVMSGFFTAMLWKKFGLKKLLKHRIRRILFPLLLGLVTVIPLQNWIISLALEKTFKYKREIGATINPESNIWIDAKLGDLNEIDRHLTKGVDINALDRKLGMTPLCWAVSSGQIEAVQFMIQKNAEVDKKNSDGGTPLHCAAIFGRVQLADLLIKNGADVNVRTNKGLTAIDAAQLDMRTTLFVAGILDIELDVQKMKENKQSTIEMLEKQGAKITKARPIQKGGQTKKKLNNLWVGFMYTPVLHHLWFLWHLIWLLLVFILMILFIQWLPSLKCPEWLVLSSGRYLLLVPLTMILQSFMGSGGKVPSFGPDLSAGILPIPHVLGFYALFFGFGMIYHVCDDFDGRISKGWWVTLLVGLFVIFPSGLATTFQLDSNSKINSFLSVLFQATYPWMMIFGLMGMFRKFFSNTSKKIRYLSDSSYWLYLMHLPLIILGQIIIREWEFPATLKFLLICTVITAFLLLIYQKLVRYTWLGALLNGRRNLKFNPKID